MSTSIDQLWSVPSRRSPSPPLGSDSGRDLALRYLEATGGLEHSGEQSPATRVLTELFLREDAQSLLSSPAAEHAFRASFENTCTFEQLAELISADPELSHDIRRLANSARFDRAGASMGVKTSVHRVGTEGTRELVMVASARRWLDLPRSPSLGNALKCRASAIAWCARSMAELLGEDPDDCFTAGLLHHVGVAVAWRLLEQNETMLGARFGLDRAIRHRIVEDAHSRLSALQVRSWGLPGRIADAVEHHHRPDEARMAPRLAWVVAAASELCDLLRYYPEQERRATYLPACRTLGLDARAVHGELTKLERDLGFSESEQDGRARGVSWLRD